MQTLLVTADDFGLCEEIDRAVYILHDRGIVHRASLVASSERFVECLEGLRARPRLAVGVHLNLTDGRPVLPPARVRSLVNRDGRFPGGRHVQILTRILGGRISRDEIREEWRAQIRRVLEAGLEIRHLNAHGHLHLLPALHPIVTSLLAEFRIPSVRLVMAVDSLRGLVFKPCSLGLVRALDGAGIHVSYPRRVLGLGRQGRLTEETLLRELRRRAEGVTELVVHPSAGQNEFHRRWGYSGDREMEALASPRVAPLLQGSPAAAGQERP